MRLRSLKACVVFERNGGEEALGRLEQLQCHGHLWLGQLRSNVTEGHLQFRPEIYLLQISVSSLRVISIRQGHSREGRRSWEHRHLADLPNPSRHSRLHLIEERVVFQPAAQSQSVQIDLTRRRQPPCRCGRHGRVGRQHHVRNLTERRPATLPQRHVQLTDLVLQAL